MINENDTTTTDEISFGDNDFLAAQVAILLGAELLVLLTSTAGVFTADPRVDPAARIVPEVDDFARSRRLDIGHPTSPLGSGGMRSKVVAAEMATAAGIPAVVGSGLEPGAVRAAAAGEAVGTRFAAAVRALLLLQALAQVRQADPRPRAGRRRRGARAARGRHEPAARRRRRGGRGLRRRRRGRGRPRRRADRQGHLATTRPPSCAGSRGCSPREARACCRGRARRPCTATTSCSPDLGVCRSTTRCGTTEGPSAGRTPRKTSSLRGHATGNRSHGRSTSHQRSHSTDS